MSILSKGTTFSTGDQVTAANLNALVDSATFATGAVDDTTTALDSSSPKKIIVKNGGIGTTQLADSSSKTTGVTFAKMQHISTAKVLGRATAGEGDVEEAFDFKDEDDMSSDSATALASQQSIKAYANAAPLAQMKTNNVLGASVASDTESITLPNGLIMKFGEGTASSGTGTVTYGVAFPNAVISVNITARDSATRGNNYPTITASSASAFSYAVNTNVTEIYWQAIGR